MKRLALSILLVLLLAFVCVSSAADHYTTTRLTADGVITNQPALWYGILIETDGTNNVTLVLYNSKSGATNEVIGKMIVAGSNYYGGVAYPFGIICSEGIFADVTGTGAAFWVYYGPRE